MGNMLLIKIYRQAQMLVYYELGIDDITGALWTFSKRECGLCHLHVLYNPDRELLGNSYHASVPHAFARNHIRDFGNDSLQKFLDSPLAVIFYNNIRS